MVSVGSVQRGLAVNFYTFRCPTLLARVFTLALFASLLSGIPTVGVAMEAAASGAPDDLHSSYARILQAYVNEEGFVAYGALANDRSSLDDYVSQLAGISAGGVDGWPEADRVALYLNAYNAFTLAAVLNHYPIEPGGWLTRLRFPASSIRQIDGVWDELEWELAGQRLTLDQIEHEVLRKQFSEPRIHMALVCASKDCPPLRAEPYDGSQLDAQLRDQAQLFLRRSSNLRIDSESHSIGLSSIFKWFAGDFLIGAGGEAVDPELAVRAFVAANLPPERTSIVASILDPTFTLHYLDYDWSLNDDKAMATEP